MLLHPRTVGALSLMTATFWLAGCTSAPQLVPTGKMTVPVQSHARTEVKARLGNEVVIQLPAVSHTGDIWSVALTDLRFLHQLRPIVMAPDGTGVADFMTIHAGRRPIRFVSGPPNARESNLNQMYEVLITIE